MGWSEWKNFGKKAIFINLGTGTSFDVKSICEENGIDYTKLTSNNFIPKVTSISGSVGVVTMPSTNIELRIGKSSTVLPSATYDNTTGTVTVKNGSVMMGAYNNANNDKGVSGSYLTSGLTVTTYFVYIEE